MSITSGMSTDTSATIHKYHKTTQIRNKLSQYTADKMKLTRTD